MAKHRTLLGSLALVLAIGSLASAGLRLQVNDESVALAGAAGPVGGLHVTILDAERKLAPVAFESQAISNGLQLAAKDRSFAGQVTAVPQGGIVFLDVKLVATHPQGKRLKVQVALPVAMGKPFTYWDGTNIWGSPTKPVGTGKPDYLLYKFPLSSVFTERQGVALGLNPRTLVSSLEFGYDPAGKIASCTLKPALFTGREIDLGFVAFGFEPLFGKASAVQVYYDAFPRCFQPQPNIDPRVYGTDGLTSNSPDKNYSPDWKRYGHTEPYSIQEMNRRPGCRWEWVYTPYYIGGDPLGDYVGIYKNAATIKATGKVVEDKQAFLALKENWFKIDRTQNMAPLHYLSAWVEKPFMDKYFPEAIAYKPEDIMTGIAYLIPGWGHAGWQSVREFPWETKYRRMTLDALKVIFTKYHAAGIAWDCLDYFGDKFRGPGIEDTNACSWDERGVFCNDANAVALLFQSIHQHTTVRGYTPAIVGNLASTYQTAFNVDGLIMERSPDFLVANPQMVDNLRLMWGSRILYQYHWFFINNLGNYIDYQSLSPAQIRKAYADFMKYFVLTCYKNGMLIGPDYIRGFETSMKNEPILEAVARAGWRPVPAMRGGKGLWLSRFGQDLGSYLVIGNPGPAIKDTPITVLNRLNGGRGSVFLPVRYDGTEMTSTIKEDETRFSVSLDKYQPLVVQNMFGIRGGEGLTARTARRISAEKIECSAAIAGRGEVELTCPIADDFTFQSAQWNGGAVTSMKAGAAAVAFKLTLVEGKEQTFQVKFSSNLFHVNQAALVALPFVTGGKPNFTIVIPDRPTEEEAAMANQFHEYFRFWCWQAQGKEVFLPIQREGQVKTDKNLIALGRLRGAQFQAEPGISLRPGNVLVLRERQGHFLNEDLFTLFKVLDAKYTYLGIMADSIFYVRPDQVDSAATKEMLQKADLLGKVLYEDGR